MGTFGFDLVIGEVVVVEAKVALLETGFGVGVDLQVA